MICADFCAAPLRNKIQPIVTFADTNDLCIDHALRPETTVAKKTISAFRGTHERRGNLSRILCKFDERPRVTYSTFNAAIFPGSSSCLRSCRRLFNRVTRHVLSFSIYIPDVSPSKYKSRYLKLPCPRALRRPHLYQFISCRLHLFQPVDR